MSVSKGDHIYFKHKSGPRSGEVKAVGKHGVTVAVGDERHKVLHEHVLGHKQRMVHQVRVVDRGEDGAVVEDHEGKRRFMAGPVPDAEGYVDKAADFELPQDGDLITARITREMKGENTFQVLAGKLPEAAVYVGDAAPEKLLSALEEQGLTIPYEIVPRTTVRRREEEHGALLAFDASADQVASLVNAVAAYQRERRAALESDEIIVVGRRVNGMESVPLSTATLGGRTVLYLGKREGFESREAFVSPSMAEEMMKGNMLAEGAQVLFVKGGNIKNRPGLTLQQTTDKSGHTTRRWKGNGEKPPTDKGGESQGEENGGGDGAPKAKVGEKVSFTKDGTSGAGEVISAGKDGATVRGEDGKEHQVYWKEVHDGASSGKTGGGEQTETPKPLFDESEMKDLPRDAAQKATSEAELYQHAEEGLNQLKAWLVPVCEEMGIKQGRLDETDLTKPGHHLFIAPLKGKARAAEKVQSDYGGDWSKLLDVVRCSVAVDTHDQVAAVVDKLKQGGMELAKAPKDRFNKPLPVGYRDLLMNVRLPNGHIAEVQVHVKGMLVAKEEGHKPYEVMRSLFAKHADKEGLADWPPEDQQSFMKAEKDSVEIYKNAWQKASTPETTMAKSVILFMGGVP